MFSHTRDDIHGTLISERTSTLLANSWANRVAVRTSSFEASNYYDISLPDYPPDLVPFRHVPAYAALDEAIQRRILAGAWIAYNEKTIGVETFIVAPACQLLLRGAFDGVNSGAIKRVIAQTQVDEQFHILMCMEACLLTRQMHGLQGLVIPVGAVVKELEVDMARAPGGRPGELIQLAYAVVAEVTINAYLDLLADDTTIQPFNRETTALHRKDEYSHRKIFADLTPQIVAHLSSEERSLFLQSLARGLEAFVKIDFNSWRSILTFLGVADAGDILLACLAGNPSSRIVRDYTGFRRLLAEMGVEEREVAFEF
ncbi:diiron oxygenase [Burkholderia glumae]|uniref:diiron oxygenase n=1 Tax=Burkholderia glumae TaxID=337 RepID=UPI0005C2A27F|nr:diiron oxygenase [Burkholderia glumae]MCM2496147.1 diiron oxygenase [Burkholderia glumae]